MVLVVVVVEDVDVVAPVVVVEVLVVANDVEDVDVVVVPAVRMVVILVVVVVVVEEGAVAPVVVVVVDIVAVANEHSLNGFHDMVPQQTSTLVYPASHGYRERPPQGCNPTQSATHIPPLRDQSMNHCVVGVMPPPRPPVGTVVGRCVGDGIGLADVGMVEVGTPVRAVVGMAVKSDPPSPPSPAVGGGKHILLGNGPISISGGGGAVSHVSGHSTLLKLK